MEEFNLTFWKKPYNSENSFVKETDAYLTSATIAVSENEEQKVFHVKLTDIGLNSKFGEFDIVKQGIFWQTSDAESVELNCLKENIMSALEFYGR